MKRFLLLCLLGLLPHVSEAACAFDQAPLMLPDKAVVPINVTCLRIGVLVLSQDARIQNPTGTPYDRQFFRLEVSSMAPRKIVWDSLYADTFGIMLPGETSGGGASDLFGFQYNAQTGRYSIVAVTTGKAVLQATPEMEGVTK